MLHKNHKGSHIPPIVPEEIKPANLSKEEIAARSKLIKILDDARNDRDQPHPELDGMTYLQYYESNRKKDLAFLPPKKNKQDVRIASGITREKDTTLLSTMLDMNFVPSITGFDTEDMVVQELGDNMSDLVKKSREIENWQKLRPIIYREMIAQGDVFAQELKVDDFREIPVNTVDWNPNVNSIADFKGFKTRLQKLFSECRVRMVNGKKVYLGNIRTPHIEDQDIVAVLNVDSRVNLYSQYANWERWENIPTTIDTTQVFQYDGLIYKSWNLVTISDEKQIAEIMVFDKKRNRFQILLNGVPMLPHNFPLTAVSPSGEIPISQGKLEPISDFAYSKSQPSKTRVEDDVLSETTKLMIEGMRQGRKPPMGTRKKRAFSPNIFKAAHITPDIKKDDLFPLYQNMGLQSADFAFYSLIKQSINDKTINDAFEGTDPGGDPTATQIKQEKQQQMLKLGLALDGVVNLERRMTWLRIHTILQNWTRKFDKDLDTIREGIDGQYRRVSVETTLENGEKGTKIFRFTTDGFPTRGEQQREERDLTEEAGHEVRIVFMNPEVLRTMKYIWFIIINPTPSSNDDLSQILFIQNLQSAMELFGPDSLNTDYLKQRFAILINEDYNKFFKKADLLEILRATGVEEVQNSTGGEKTNVTPARAQRKTPLRSAVR